MSLFTPEAVRGALAQHGTQFFTHDLQPVTPREGQWFCEFHIAETMHGEEVRDEELVEYVGISNDSVYDGGVWVPRPYPYVAPEHDDARRPLGDILILQH